MFLSFDNLSTLQQNHHHHHCHPNPHFKKYPIHKCHLYLGCVNVCIARFVYIFFFHVSFIRSFESLWLCILPLGKVCNEWSPSIDIFNNSFYYASIQRATAWRTSNNLLSVIYVAVFHSSVQFSSFMPPKIFISQLLCTVRAVHGGFVFVFLYSICTGVLFSFVLHLLLFQFFYLFGYSAIYVKIFCI